MRIRELLEGKKFNDLDWVRKDGEGKEEIDFDLTEDLVFFMNNDDDVYRRHVYPSISKCLERIKSNQDVSPSMFKNAVAESYKSYVKKFPIRHLPNSLDEKQFEDACKKMCEEFREHHDDGRYED